MGTFQKILTTSIWAITVIMMIFIVTVGLRIQRSMRDSANAAPLGVTGPNAVVQNDAVAITQASQLPKLFPAPTFDLLDQQNQPFGTKQLGGKPWLAQFIYTTCPTMCPMMIAKMARIQQSSDPRLQLISFSVDPTHDRPDVLKAKAASLDAEEARWHFLTNPDGVPDGIDHVQRGFFQAKPGPQEPITMHSDKFFLVDGDGQVRGIYSSNDEQQMMRLTNDAKILCAASSNTAQVGAATK